MPSGKCLNAHSVEYRPKTSDLFTIPMKSFSVTRSQVRQNPASCLAPQKPRSYLSDCLTRSRRKAPRRVTAINQSETLFFIFCSHLASMSSGWDNRTYSFSYAFEAHHEAVTRHSANPCRATTIPARSSHSAFVAFHFLVELVAYSCLLGKLLRLTAFDPYLA
jgi:hypothetical protein